MTPERWQRVKELFDSASELEAEERRVFLNQQCAGDDELRREVESLLESDDDSESFMESPAVEDAAGNLIEEEKLQAGQKIARYEIVSMIGEGGMGEVYLAHDSRLKRKVALKLLPSYLSKDKGRLRRFEQEAEAASALNHPNVCTIHEIRETEDNRSFIAMEFVDGTTLRQRLEQGQIKLNEALEIAIQVASALTAAHEAGITHRDIKPENIMIRRDGYVKVLDFGLAKLAEQQRQTSRIITKSMTKSGLKTEPGVVLGTAQYMSPEQARGKPVDARTDIWAVGAVLYEMAAGRPAFEGETTSDIIAGVLEREPVPLARYAPKLPENVEWIISKALRKDKEERYQTSKELLTDLRSVKQRLEFEIELERSTPPNKASGAIAAALSGEQQAVHDKSATPNVTPTSEVSRARRTSSAEYVISGIKQHKLGTGLALSVLLAAVIGLTYFYYFAPGTKAAITSIAILPFVNVGGDPNMEYLSDGITESLINSLSRLPQMKVIARSSVFQYKGKETDPQVVGRELGVEAVLTGRIVQRGDTLSISAELVDARNKSHLWGEQYNRKTTDLVAVQEELSRDISEKLRAKLTGAQEQQVTKRHTSNNEAYQLYLKGLYLHNKQTPDAINEAIVNFERAMALDPNYALAYQALADSYSWLGNFGYLDPKEATPKTKAAALKALEIDSTLAGAHATLAFIKTVAEMNIADPSLEKDYKRAIELNPNLARAHTAYSNFLIFAGRYDEAIAEAKRAQELDPLSPRASNVLGVCLTAARRYDEAINQFKRILEMDPNNTASRYNLAIAYKYKGMYKEAITEYQKVIEAEGTADLGVLAMLGSVHAAAGNKAEAEKLLAQIKSTKQYVSPLDMAILYISLGDKEQAIASLQKGYEDRDPQILNIKGYLEFDALRSEPRFQDLLRRIGLTP
jgi:serine/threonine-protein kinase